MSTSITADDMLAALKRWGIAPKFYKPDWRTHNRTAVQGWGPLYGFIVHNFASDISDATSLAYLYNGDAARNLPGPLSQFAITDDGQVWVIGWGTANHAGTVDSDTHALVVKDAMPRDRDVVPNTSGSSTSGTVKGGPRYIGVEMTYGAKGPTSAQRSSCVRLAAAMAEMVGGTGGSVVGHRECTTTRSDPQFIPMGPFRRDVDALIKAGPGKTSSGTSDPAPAPTPLEEDIMATLDDLRKAIREETGKAVAEYMVPNVDTNPKDGVAPAKWAARSYWVMANWRAADLQKQVAGLRTELAGLTAAMGALAKAQGADATQIAALVDKAVRDRLSQVRFDVTDTPTA